MSTKYFILTKPEKKEVNDNTENQIICLTGQHIQYILPQNNLTYYTEKGLFENQLIEWCKQFCSPEKVFLDIGAHTGTYALSLSSRSKHVYAFEPQKMTYYGLCGSVALSNLDNITCLHFGLGSEEQSGKNILKIVSNDGGGSSLHAEGNILREEEIEIRRLDDLNIQDIGFIKMDVENNELFVLQGGVETLKQSNYPKILFESNQENNELFHFVKDLGYTIVQINGVYNMFLACK